MYCPACQQPNRQGAKFCAECGASLPAGCPSCGTTLRPNAKFCDECGQPVAPAPGPATVVTGEAAAPTVRGYTPRHLAEQILTTRAALEGERKQVTVLFVDCVGFTALSTRLDPEDLHTIMDGCFQHLLDAVHRYEGTVNQFTGDGVMALFGAPIAHEDHAVRAVAAALAIQDAVTGYADTLRRERGLEFAVRVGLNTGNVVVGRIGDDLRMDYTAQGETVNLAARLQAAAAAGGILISEATHALVADYFELDGAGALDLKGLDQPVQAFAVTGQRDRRARFDIAVARGLTPLVGRAHELTWLREGLAAAMRGQGSVISLVGEAGLGKSRLVYEVLHGVSSGDWAVLEAHCAPHGTTAPLHGVVELLHALLGLADGESERVRRTKLETAVAALGPTRAWTLPYLAQALGLPGDELEATGLEPTQRKRQLVAALKTVLLTSAEARPLLLVVEDLQWIDAASAEVLSAVVDALPATPMLLLCTYRPGYTPAWHERSFHQRHVLRPLAADATATMIQALLDGAAVPSDLAQLVSQRAEGNPLFVEELTRFLSERGRLGVDAAAAPPAALGEIPSTVQALLTARIDRLPPPLKYTLQLAAVLGREFPSTLLAALVPEDPELPMHLAALVSLELLHEQTQAGEPRYRFSHLLVQQVTYESLLLRARAALHARAGAALERLYGDRLDDVLPALAEHYARSLERAKAVHYLGRAGDRAAGLFAYDEARECYQRALDLLGVAPESARERGTLSVRLGAVAFAHGALAEALGAWDAALALLADDPREVADLHGKMAAACWAAGSSAAALDHLERGEAALGDDKRCLAAARLYQERARIYLRLGDHGSATRDAQRALALGVALGAADAVAHACNTLGVAQAREGDLEQGATLTTRALETALAHGLSAMACRAYTNLAVMYTTLDHTRAAAYCQAGLALAQQIGDELQQSWLYCTLAGGHCTLEGDYDEGIRAAETAAALDRRLGQRSHLPIPLIILAQIHQCGGDYARSESYYQEALAVAEEVGEPQLRFPCYEGLAMLAIERGDEAEAETWLARSRAIQETTGWQSDVLFVLPFLC